ncbi:MAG TPA: peptidylprolyl isomerase [Gammaproteobacteria bacterium]|nr:peptidylprolyl isomerase [Gammaproteobacteria bacterium]
MSRFFRLPAFFLLLSLAPAHGMAAQPVQVQMQTNYGNITLELYPDKAPQTVANFLHYVDSGFYEKTIFHRVIPGFMIQGGGFDLDYQQKPTQNPVPNEANNGLKNARGTIAMARTSDPHSATAQFFINVVDNDFLNYRSSDPQGWGYCVYGKVIDGMKVADEIARIPTGSGGSFPTDVPQKPVVIEAVKRIATPAASSPKKSKQAPAKPEATPAPAKETPSKETSAKEAPVKSQPATKETP